MLHAPAVAFTAARLCLKEQFKRNRALRSGPRLLVRWLMETAPPKAPPGVMVALDAAVVATTGTPAEAVLLLKLLSSNRATNPHR